MENDFRDRLKIFNALPTEEQQRIINSRLEKKQAEFKIEEQTNAQIAEMTEFINFCSEKNIIPSKRQASKNRGEFIEWYNKQRQ